MRRNAVVCVSACLPISNQLSIFIIAVTSFTENATTIGKKKEIL